MQAGSSTRRMSVASRGTATASLTPSSWVFIHPAGREDDEHAGHHERRADDDRGGGAQALLHRLVDAAGGVVDLAAAGEQEDLVVDAQREDDREHADRAHRVRPARPAEQRVVALEGEHEHGEGHADEEQVVADLGVGQGAQEAVAATGPG